MKRSISYLVGITMLATIVSCGQRNTIPESLVDVKHYVHKLDSSLAITYGWEPQDSTYNESVDTMVLNILNQYKEDHPDAETEEWTEHAIEQSTYDNARVTWGKFKTLIDADKYEQALDFYYSENEETGKKNAGDFLVFLKQSFKRFVFFSSVLRPMLYEYREDTFATEEYIDVLQLEKAMEDMTMTMSPDYSSYVPEVYPYVIQDLGKSLVKMGRLEDAEQLFEDYVNAIHNLTGDSLYANLCGTIYITNLYLQDGKPDWALGSWENFKDFLEKNKDYYNPSNLQECLERIEEEMVKLADYQE